MRVARVELMDLLCDRLGLPKTRVSYRDMNHINWSFGQKYTLPSNVHLWATDTQYTSATTEKICHRRDKFLVRGTEKINVTLPNGQVAVTPTALCCEAVCFIRIAGVHKIARVSGHFVSAI